MVIFVNEDRAYLSWLAHHRHGFVLDMLRRPTRKPPVLHRAVCADIRSSKSARTRRTHWTTGRHVKACGLQLDELLAWADTEADHLPVYCDHCRPNDATAADRSAEPRHLTRLGKDIVDYVVEAAVVFLDQGTGAAPGAVYDTTVGEVAAYLGKTPAQLTAALTRLVADGYLRIEDRAGRQEEFTATARVFPTADALRMLPAFEQLSPDKVEAELEQLADDETPDNEQSNT